MIEGPYSCEGIGNGGVEALSDEGVDCEIGVDSKSHRFSNENESFSSPVLSSTLLFKLASVPLSLGGSSCRDVFLA